VLILVSPARARSSSPRRCHHESPRKDKPVIRCTARRCPRTC
jgi:hypothetical protein